MISEYICNLCGTQNQVEAGTNEKVPGPICSKCHSATRFRKCAYLISKHVFGGTGRLDQDADSDLKGIGLSDAHPVENCMKRFSNYENTYYHKEPMVDIMQPPAEPGIYDYLISSDVFEHTPPPVAAPYHNAFAYLRKGGKFILSVPAQPTGKEHFPNLSDFQILETKEGHTLVNATTSGELEVFDDLRFHGGPGSTLEMRIFSPDQVMKLLKEAGFSKVEAATDLPEEFGVSDIRGLSSFWIATK